MACKHCGMDMVFFSHNRSKFCSKKCYDAFADYKKYCLNCHNIITNRCRQKYCSSSCEYVYLEMCRKKLMNEIGDVDMIEIPDYIRKIISSDNIPINPSVMLEKEVNPT